jgi:hypothetical protein
MDANADRALGSCAGFRVEAADGVVGEVETPLFPADAAAPDYLVVRAAIRGRVRRPVVPSALIVGIDPARRVVVVRGRRHEIANLAEHLPVARWQSSHGAAGARSPTSQR